MVHGFPDFLISVKDGLRRGVLLQADCVSLWSGRGQMTQHLDISAVDI